jgi:hypothetical protein
MSISGQFRAVFRINQILSFRYFFYRVFEAVINCFTKVTFHDCLFEIKIIFFFCICVPNNTSAKSLVDKQLKKQEI